MALNDTAVITAAVGYVFTAPVGTAAPTPAELDATDPALFGAQVQTITLAGSPTGGTFTLASGANTTSALPYNATAAQIQAALEALASIGVGNVAASGTLAAGVQVAFIGTKQGQALAALTVNDTGLTGGSTPEITVAITTAPNGWISIGHTSRDDMPEFGFDGGDTKVLGTWQNASLREVVTTQPSDYVTLHLHQFDATAMSLYYGPNASVTPGVFAVAGGQAQPNEHAFLIVIVDGDTRIGFYAPKASVRRDDSIDLPVDEFASMPIRATFLKNGAANLYEWISQDLITTA